MLARSAFDKDLHTTILYSLLGLSAFITAFLPHAWLQLPFLLVLVPIAISLRYGPRFLSAARLAEERSLLERRPAEVLAQQARAPMRRSEGLAPAPLPGLAGLEVGP